MTRPAARRGLAGKAGARRSHRQVVVLGLESERAGHAAAAGVELGDLGAGDLRSSAERRGGARERLLVAVAVEQDAAAADGLVLRQVEPAVGDGLEQQFLRQAGRAATACARRVAGQQGQVLVAQREQARGLHADDRHAAAGRVTQARGHARRHPPGLVEQALGQAGPATAARGLEPDLPAGELQQLDRRAPGRGLGEGGEGVRQEDQLALGCWRRRARPAPQPAEQVCRWNRGSGRAALIPSQRSPARRAGRHPAGRVRQRERGRAQPVQRPDGPEHARARAGRRADRGRRRATRSSATPCRRRAGTRSCRPCTPGRGRGCRAAARHRARRAGPAGRARRPGRWRGPWWSALRHAWPCTRGT